MNFDSLGRLRVGLAVGVVVLLSGFGVVAVFFSNRLPSGFTSSVPVSAGTVQVVIGAVLVGVGVLYLRQPQPDAGRDMTTNLSSSETPPEQPKRPPRIVGERFDAATNEALREVRLKGADYDTTDPHQILSETVQRIFSARGYDPAETEQQITTGEWTVDPVAKGFLSDSVGYPVWFNLLRWAKPGFAYRRAVDRTALAVLSLLDGLAYEPASTTGWFSEFRADVKRYLDDGSVNNTDDPESETVEPSVTDPPEAQ